MKGQVISSHYLVHQVHAHEGRLRDDLGQFTGVLVIVDTGEYGEGNDQVTHYRSEILEEVD